MSPPPFPVARSTLALTGATLARMMSNCSFFVPELTQVTLLLSKRRPAASGTSTSYAAQTPGMAGDFFESPRSLDANFAAGTLAAKSKAPSSPSAGISFGLDDLMSQSLGGIAGGSMSISQKGPSMMATATSSRGGSAGDLSHGGSQAEGDADDILGAMFGTNSGSETASPRGMTPVSGSVPNDMDAFDVFASGTAGNTGEENSSANMSGGEGDCATDLERAVERARSKTSGSSRLSSVTRAEPVVDGFAGFDDLLSPGPGSMPKASVGGSGPASSGPSSSAPGRDSLEDLLGVGTSSKKPAGAAGISLGDELDGLFGGPSVPSGQPAVIDDMFGPMMGSGGVSSSGVATTIAGKVTLDEIEYDGSDDEQEGDTEERTTARKKRHDRVRAAMQAKLQEKRDREIAAVAEQAERQVLKDLIGAEIDEWLRQNQGNIRTMLAKLGDVLWENHGYKAPDLNELIEANSVKKAYHKALIIIHPDKVRQKGGSTDQCYIADRVFDQVRDAYKAMCEKEM